MKYFNLVFLGFVALCVFFSCNSTPAPADSDIQSPVEESLAEETVIEDVPVEEVPELLQPEETKFDSSMISKEQYEEEKTEIQLLVDELNKITRSKAYERWLLYLSPEYKEYYSDKEVLKAQTARLPKKNLRLTTLQDYFNIVFVISRQNCRVDDISYLSPTRVKVIQREPSTALIIYNLEKCDGEWKIILDN